MGLNTVQRYCATCDVYNTCRLTQSTARFLCDSWVFCIRMFQVE